MDVLETVNIAVMKKTALVRVTADQLITRQASFVFGVYLTGSSGGAATAAIYDGVSTHDDPKIDLGCPTSGSDNKRFYPPAYFSKGIYIDVGSNVTSVVVHFLSAE